MQGHTETKTKDDSMRISQQQDMQKLTLTKKLSDEEAKTYDAIVSELKNLTTSINNQYIIAHNVANIIANIARYITLCGDLNKVNGFLNTDKNGSSYRSLLIDRLITFPFMGIKINDEIKLALAMVSFYFGLSDKTQLQEVEINKAPVNGFTEIKAAAGRKHSEIALEYIKEISTNNKSPQGIEFANYVNFLKILCEFYTSSNLDFNEYEKVLKAAAERLNTAYSYLMLAKYYSMDSVQKYVEAAIYFNKSSQLGYELVNEDFQRQFIVYVNAFISGYKLAAINIKNILYKDDIFDDDLALNNLFKLYKFIASATKFYNEEYNEYNEIKRLVINSLRYECVNKFICGDKATPFAKAKYAKLCEDHLEEKIYTIDDLNEDINIFFESDLRNNNSLKEILEDVFKNLKKDKDGCYELPEKFQDYIEDLYKKVENNLIEYKRQRREEIGTNETQESRQVAIPGNIIIPPLPEKTQVEHSHTNFSKHPGKQEKTTFSDDELRNMFRKDIEKYYKELYTTDDEISKEVELRISDFRAEQREAEAIKALNSVAAATTEQPKIQHTANTVTPVVRFAPVKPNISTTQFSQRLRTHSAAAGDNPGDAEENAKKRRKPNDLNNPTSPGRGL